MIRWRVASRPFVAVAVVVALGVASTASAALSFTPTVLMNQPGYDFTGPKIGGRYIVAERTASTSDIVVYDLQTGVDTSIGYGDGKDQDMPAISGSRIAWIDHTEADGEVWYDDRADIIAPRRITTDAADDVAVSIDGNHIAWMNGQAPGRQIRWFDIDRNVFGTVPGTNLPNGVSVDRGRICWFDTDKTVNYDGVYLYDIATGDEMTVRERLHSAATIAPDSPALHGDIVAWSETPDLTPTDSTIYIKNVRTKSVLPVSGNIFKQLRPSVFGDLTVWQDERNATDDIYGMWEPDWPDDQVVTASEWNEVNPDVFGRSVVSQQDVGELRVALFVAPLAPTRISGDDRYETSAEIARTRFGAATNAVLATGEDFPDALCASALAGALDAPLLLTRKDTVPASITSALTELGVENVWIVGGTGVISTAVDTQLTTAGMTVMPRVSGVNRYETAKQVAYLVMGIVQSNPEGYWRHEAFFVRGDEFADALSVAPHAYNEKIPILLVAPDDVPQGTEDAVTFCYITEGHIIGGTGAVSASVAAEIDAMLGDAADRWSGADRYATSAACAAHGVARGWLDFDDLGIATGLAFPDALSGGAACGYYGSPLILTPPTAIVPTTNNFLDVRRFEFGGMTIFGGIGAVSDSLVPDLTAYLN
ncbi:MAG: cell wall-binding repeat-containing protein [Coriobacteriia bacterium]|nr:cell wall-binding repeat-containing protein [Coriobacteriia bacterium]